MFNESILTAILVMVSWLVKKVYYLNHKVTVIDLILSHTNPEYARFKNNKEEGR